MADKVIVSKSKITALADSIRAKAGTTGAMSFDAMKTAVDGISSGGGSATPLDSVAYYKANRNPEYPYFPLPSEMTETEDTIYMLYGANGYMCCPVFQVTFSNCVCTVYKYNNTTLVSSYVESLTSNTPKYMQFSEEDEDYSTYNYIVIKLQGTITTHSLDYYAKFNDVSYSNISSDELIEVSGKCISCSVSAGGSSYKYHQNLEYYSFLGVNSTNMSNMFNSCHSLQAIPQLDTSSVTNMSNMFYNCYSLQTIPELDTSSVTNMNNMFYSCGSLQTIPELDTSSVASMNNMFQGCHSLQTIPELDTNQVTNMSNMFNNCYSLQTIPELDTSSVASMSSMFNYCYSLQTIPELDTNQVTNMSKMFYNCCSLQTIPELDTSSVTNMSNMFNSCCSLQTIPELDTSSVTNMSNMFYNCYLLAKCDSINMKVSFSLTESKMLSHDKLLTILNNLAPVTTTQTLTLGSTNLDKLSDDEKAIATNKGWTLA